MGKLAFLLKTGVILGLSTAIFGSAAYFAHQIFVAPYKVPEEVPGVPLPTPPDPSLPELEKALDLVRKNELLKARTALETFLTHYPFSSRIDEARAALGDLNVKIFFSDIPAPEKIRYTVARGDALIKIERKLKISREVLMRCNGITDPSRLRVGQVLTVTPTDFSIRIDRKNQTLLLLNNHRFFKEYKAIAWEVPASRQPGARQEPIETTVRDKIAWHEGSRVAFGSKEYPMSRRWIMLGQRSYTFFCPEGPKPPAGGIVFSTADMEELSTFLGKNVPVSIQ